MAYKQKYLKYKQKYQELKKHLSGEQYLEIEDTNDVKDFILTDTPNEGSNLHTQIGGGNETEVLNLSDTPTFLEQSGAGAVQEEMVSTTDVSDIHNTENIERLLNQAGGKKRSRKSSRKSSRRHSEPTHEIDIEPESESDLESSSSTASSSDSITDISSSK